MLFQAPPTPPPQPPEVVRTESGYLRVARKDVPLLITRERASSRDPGEKALIRYQLFVRVDVEARQNAAKPEDETPPPIHCQWVATSYLEREPCFESITGRLACGESYTVRLDDIERGTEVLPLTAEPSACALARPEIAAAQARLGAAIGATADDRFADDLARRLTPSYARAGLKAAIRPLP